MLKLRFVLPILALTLAACGDKTVINIMEPGTTTTSQFYIAQTQWLDMYGSANGVATNAMVICVPKGANLHVDATSNQFPYSTQSLGQLPPNQDVCPGTAWSLSLTVYLPNVIFTAPLYVVYTLDTGASITQKLQVHVQSSDKG